MRSIILSVLIISVLSGCSAFSPYKAPIQQGQIITDDQVSQLALGMSRAQVTQLLGTSSMPADLADGAKLLYSIHQGDNKSSLLVLQFSNDRLTQIN